MKTHLTAIVMAVVLFALMIGCSLRVRSTGNAQIDNIGVEVDAGKANQVSE
jgi:hypothetical protein